MGIALVIGVPSEYIQWPFGDHPSVGAISLVLGVYVLIAGITQVALWHVVASERDARRAAEEAARAAEAAARQERETWQVTLNVARAMEERIRFERRQVEARCQDDLDEQERRWAERKAEIYEETYAAVLSQAQAGLLVWDEAASGRHLRVVANE
ncbi:hypothetical protein [Streptomyces youssoufiensis]